MNRRLDMLEKGSARDEVLEQLRKEMSQHLNSKGIPLYSILADKAQKANIAFSPRQLIMIMAVLCVLAFVGLTVGTQAGLPVRIIVAIAMGVGGVYVWVNNKAKKRLSLIEEQLPDAIELMVRMDMQDLRFLAVAVTIQQQSGGNLAEILHGLAQVIRARFKLFRRVKAITAEAKWSGMFLSVFPILALVMIIVIKPDYFDEVQGTAAFIPACLIVGTFLVVNVIFMKIMFNIKV